MSTSAFVLLLCCLCAVVLWPADTAPAGAEPAATTAADRAVSTEPTVPAGSTGASSVYVQVTAADATDPVGRDGSADDGEVSVSLEQTLDTLLGLVADTAGSVFNQHSAELKKRMDDLNAEVHRGTRLATNASTAILRLLNGQTRLEDSHQGLQEVVLRGLARTETELEVLRHGQTQLQTGLTQLRAEHNGIIDMLEFLQPCPTGWSRGGKACLAVTEDTPSWPDADSFCKAKHPQAELASVHMDNKEQVRHLLRTSDGIDYWIGLRRGSDDQTWLWTDGTSLDFTDWQDGEPNNVDGTEDCVHYHFDDGVGSWNDNKCVYQMHALCEIMVPDFPSTTA